MNVTAQTKKLAADILDYWAKFNNHEQISWIGDEIDDLYLWEIDVDDVFTVEKVDGKEYNVCQTTLCAAGTAVFLSVPLNEFKRLTSANNVDNGVNWGNPEWIERGRDLLGLSEREARVMFMEAGNDDAKAMMKAIADGDQAELTRLVREVSLF